MDAEDLENLGDMEELEEMEDLDLADMEDVEEKEDLKDLETEAEVVAMALAVGDTEDTAGEVEMVVVAAAEVVVVEAAEDKASIGICSWLSAGWLLAWACDSNHLPTVIHKISFFSCQSYSYNKKGISFVKVN